ncbi:MAG: hypothetical protein ABUL42_01325 [Terricaulis silvestris]
MRGVLIFTALALALAACGPKPQAGSQATSTAPAAPASVDPASLNGHIIARGEGWTLDEDAKAGFVFAMPAQHISLTAAHAAATRDGLGAKLTSGGLTLSLTPQACTFAGVAYPMTADIETPRGVQHGCAVVRWDHDLITLLPGIDACLAQATEPMSVTYAAPENNGEFVRLKLDEESFDCHAPSDANAQASMEPASETHYPGENDAVFVRAPGDNPGGDCYQAPEVRATDGTLIGWWDEPRGCPSARRENSDGD